ncbi:LPS export ABC transporter periplasmic protein LptC [Weeksella sp. HMSC059D05]|uniref:LPS export ABC transporter periplasmic protein LptC n=1 Tax=Weeksella virosa (strain ATCC 43766 / DSM 16922 / JCM 21250 / CCUG 30538 / CDC 9751 / IAM 14551 / NBRC 16016 / NCTC 11634 / CL345/78) TaxID=865938 RepID=F0P297_WEEVC|nr:protein of unknown function DUF1239 [Weeksella virosa DSM 16922]OFM82761.1 LPS export ABC transporter periplasmic protein LptC [Weeksella sp. HMSC059D05]SUP54086.1 Uncharacterized protein conserved in bacteria [Weeksella virosa]VEH64586.1 Uncharacterized protein conserved in bacteria [Weeksella virosa]
MLIHPKTYNKSKVGFLISFIFFFSCERGSSNLGTPKKVDFPDRVLYQAHILHKDSGRLQVDMRAPKIEIYSLLDSPYTLFPKGLNLDFYEKGKAKPGYFQANWAKLNDATQIYEGKGNVIVVNEKGDSLKTEHLFWNKISKKVYTTKEVFIISKQGDSLHAQNGLESTDDLERYTLYNNRGFMWIDEKEAP